MMKSEETREDSEIWRNLDERRRQARESIAKEYPDADGLMASLLRELQGGLDRLSEAHIDHTADVVGAVLSAGVEAFTAAVCAARDGFSFQAYPALRFAIECASIVTGLAHASPDDRAKQVEKLRTQLDAAAIASEGMDKIESSTFRKLLEKAGEEAQAEGQFQWIQHLHLYAHPSPYAIVPYYFEDNLGDPIEAARLGRQSTIHTLFAAGQILGHALRSVPGQHLPGLDAVLSRVDKHLTAWSERTMPEGAVVTSEDLLNTKRGRLARQGNTQTLTGQAVGRITASLGKLAEDWPTVDAEQCRLVHELRTAMEKLPLTES